MHIVDGALSNPVVIGGAVLAVGGIARGLRSLPMEKIPVAGVLSAMFFVASLVHVPVGPTSVHLIMNGLAGLVLGWAAFPALFVGLLLQAVFFGFGGVTALGVNTLVIAGPAVLVWALVGGQVRRGSARDAAIWAGIGGALAIALTAIAVAGMLALSGEGFVLAAKAVIAVHLPVMVVEGLLAAAAVHLVKKVKPELFAPIGGALA
ncbi:MULTISPECIES: cobalt transporter CbiM [Tropicimonas]|uniref:Cobalt/nickel transport system permease protein n=2 Tax=Tropicimonas TaxID=599652 RepID=A0A239EXN6_9RHOB|nr:cobalt transporter CbiM [Tropicimonas sediminicola]SNS49347.1 cobalt/nickel transport system permease protein [Tropicimonas sediminicola]